MFTKRFSLILLTAWATLQLAHAVIAFPRPIVVTQADGASLTIVIKGDEHGHLAMTTDGYPVWYNDSTGNYEYATLADGELAGSGIVAADADDRSDIDNAYLSTIDGEAIFKANQRSAKVRRAKSNATRALVNTYPTTGEVHALVILVEFSDLKFSTVGDDAKDFYTRMLNEKGFTYTNGANGSARDYYVDNSNGKFQPTFDVVGPITMPNTMKYYGANSGGSDNYTIIAEMIAEACRQAHDNYGVNFAQYDNNGDGQVDNVYVIYAGYGEADTGNTNTIWPHSAYLTDMTSNVLELDDRMVNNYTCCNEINGQRRGQPTGIGLFVHEFSHVLGLPDHYDIYYSSATFTPGYYDVMDEGSYNNNTNTPPLFSAYERGELGWLDYTELSSDSSIVKTLPELGASNKAYRVSVPDNDDEYYVLENRQLTGWDAYLPGHGMLMWHIDYNAKAWIDNEVNITSSHQRVDIVEADNRRTSGSTDGDTFPGASNVTSWEMNAWDGTKLATLDDIREKDGDIEIVLGGMDYKLDAPTITISDVDDTSATISWSSVDLADTYLVEIFREGGWPEEETNSKEYKDITTLTVDSLQPETNYAVIVRAKRGSYISEWAYESFTTTATPYTKKKPGNLVASNVQSTAFDASWDAVEEANQYEVTLTKNTFDSTNTTTISYDFSEQEEGMPKLWEYKGGFFSLTDCYGESAPALRMPRSGGYLTIASMGNMISGVTFWGKGSSTVNGTVRIERYENGEWSDAETFVPIPEAQTLSFTFDPCEKARISFSSLTGVFYVDDVVATCIGMEREVVATQLTSDTSISFDSLKNDAIYGVTVVALTSDGERSSASDELLINMEKVNTGISPVVASPATNAQPSIYDLNGRRIDSPSSLPGNGIYIIKKGEKTEKRGL